MKGILNSLLTDPLDCLAAHTARRPGRNGHTKIPDDARVGIESPLHGSRGLGCRTRVYPCATRLRSRLGCAFTPRKGLSTQSRPTAGACGTEGTAISPRDKMAVTGGVSRRICLTNASANDSLVTGLVMVGIGSQDREKKEVGNRKSKRVMPWRREFAFDFAVRLKEAGGYGGKGRARDEKKDCLRLFV